MLSRSIKSSTAARRGFFRPPYVAGIVSILPLGLIAIVLTATPASNKNEVQPGQEDRNGGRLVPVGGVMRPEVDVTPKFSTSLPVDPPKKRDGEEGRGGYGRIPTVETRGKPELEILASKILMGAKTDAPEVFGPMLAAKPFNRDEFEKDPKAYLSKFEPGRVWQSAQPGDGVPVLIRLSPRKHSLLQTESVRLVVQAPRGAPVAFSSFDGGVFENQLSNVTVLAGEDGKATATFTATRGTIRNATVLAASPLATGRVQFQLVITQK